MITECSVDNTREFSALCVSFDLAIPEVGIELIEPFAKSPKFGRVQLGNLLFELVNGAHGQVRLQDTIGRFNGRASPPVRVAHRGRKGAESNG